VTYADSGFATPQYTNDLVSYSVRLFSATEAGPDSTVVNQVLYDILVLPLGPANTIATWGSRSTLAPTGQGLFAGCSGGLVKVINDPATLEPVPTQSASYPGIESIVSGDLTRIVVAGNTNQMFLVDPSNLSLVMPAISTLGWSGASNDTGLYDASISGQGAAFTGTSVGIYKGWTLATQEGSGVKGAAPWNAAVDSFQNYDRSLALTGFVQPFIALPLINTPGSQVQPSRLEAIGGDALCFVLQATVQGSTTTYNTTLFQVQRGNVQAVEIFSIPDYVMAAVSDGVSKVLALDIAGNVWLIDMSLVPPSSGIGYQGYNSQPVGAVIGTIPLPSVYVPPVPGTAPVGHPGDLVFLATGSMSVELGAGQVVATSVYDGSKTTVNVFAIPTPPLSLGTALALTQTYVVSDNIANLAFDGGVFFYGRAVGSSKLYRFNAGL
jgi:hypothetical protein